MVSDGMKQIQQTRHLEALSYRLSGSVDCHMEDGKLVLVLHFPLKGIGLNPWWRPLFERLSRGEPLTPKAICDSMGDADPEKVELFLNELVHKGYLERRGVSRVDNYPSVSVIIPVRDRPIEIAACLRSLENLDYPPDKLEIIVVDDASTDDTPETVSRFPVRLVSLMGHRQAPFCRNLGAKRARGQILAFVDSDCLADPLWLKELTPGFKDGELGAIGGLVESFFHKKTLDRYEAVRSSLNMGSRFKSSRENDPFFYVPSCNLLVRREAFLELGGFREDLVVGEDVDLCWRLQDRGYPVAYVPMGRVFHKHRNRLISFCLRRFDYGTSEPLLQRLHTGRTKRLYIPPAAAVFWVLILLGPVMGNFLLSGLGGIVLLTDLFARWRKIRRKNMPIGFFQTALSAFRGYLSFFYHISAFVSRYYLVCCLFFLPFVPVVFATIVGMHLITGIVDYMIKRPHLNPLWFLFYFTMEQLSYQLGVWWGCLKNIRFGPVAPRITWRSPVQEA